MGHAPAPLPSPTGRCALLGGLAPIARLRPAPPPLLPCARVPLRAPAPRARVCAFPCRGLLPARPFTPPCLAPLPQAATALLRPCAHAHVDVPLPASAPCPAPPGPRLRAASLPYRGHPQLPLLPCRPASTAACRRLPAAGLAPTGLGSPPSASAPSPQNDSATACLPRIGGAAAASLARAPGPQRLPARARRRWVPVLVPRILI
nr:nascent polypeptide-associated complex subunit alpha, muscle-specific form-like [Aegilops tauschii subsp. strangulata]